MKRSVLVTAVVVVLLGIGGLVLWQKGKATPAPESGTVQWVDPNTIQPGPIQHETLTEGQLARIKRIHTTFAEIQGVTLEATIEDFKRDLHVDREIAIWEGMAKAYEKYVAANPRSLDAKKEAFKVILMRSMASEDEAIAHLKLSVLTEQEARTIMRSYPVSE